jgi:hypothetical protein
MWPGGRGRMFCLGPEVVVVVFVLFLGIASVPEGSLPDWSHELSWQNYLIKMVTTATPRQRPSLTRKSRHPALTHAIYNRVRLCSIIVEHISRDGFSTAASHRHHGNRTRSRISLLTVRANPPIFLFGTSTFLTPPEQSPSLSPPRASHPQPCSPYA